MSSSLPPSPCDHGYTSAQCCKKCNRLFKCKASCGGEHESKKRSSAELEQTAPSLSSPLPTKNGLEVFHSNLDQFKALFNESRIRTLMAKDTVFDVNHTLRRLLTESAKLNSILKADASLEGLFGEIFPASSSSSSSSSSPAKKAKSVPKFFHTSYSFRAKCKADVDAFAGKIAEYDDIKVCDWEEFPDEEGMPDVDVVFQAEDTILGGPARTLQKLRNILRDITDGHVMLESLNFTNKYYW